MMHDLPHDPISIMQQIVRDMYVLADPRPTGAIPLYASDYNVVRYLRHPDRAGIAELKSRVGTSLYASQLEGAQR